MLQSCAKIHQLLARCIYHQALSRLLVCEYDGWRMVDVVWYEKWKMQEDIRKAESYRSDDASTAVLTVCE